MGIDKLKIASTIKLCMLAFYLVYLISFNTSLSIYLPESRNSDVSVKEKLVGDYCLLIIGGSNVRQGISAQLLSENICPTLNLGVNGEMEYFDSYRNWLAKILNNRKYKYTIYSPSIFWASKSIINKNPDYITIPRVSLFTQLKNMSIDSKSIFNSHGDLEIYSCSSEIISFNINEVDFLSSNVIVAQEIKQRLSKLKDVANSNSIYIRVPPVYVKTKEIAERYENLMNTRIEILRSLGVKIVGSTIASSDRSLFCDSFHPNAKGREAFTNEIRLP